MAKRRCTRLRGTWVGCALPRGNLGKRLAEAFWNLQWQLAQQPSQFRLEEFQIYEQFYGRCQHLFSGQDLKLIQVPYQAVKTLVAHRLSV